MTKHSNFNPDFEEYIHTTPAGRIMEIVVDVFSE